MAKVLLGLPGLYQNWLMTVLDPEAAYYCNGSNFKYDSDDIKWLSKNYEYQSNPDFIRSMSDSTIINLYVDEKNFIWYLQNFIGKTDEIFLDLDNLLDELESKAPGTKAFDNFYHHFIDTYEIKSDTALDIKIDSLIEYLYLSLVLPDNRLKQISMLKFDLPNITNIEYEDFNDIHKLRSKLSLVSNLDLSSFDDKHQQLQDKNHLYLNQRKILSEAIIRNTDITSFNILDQAKIGYFIGMISKQSRLDWFNPLQRQDLYRIHRSDLAILVNSH